MNILKGKVQSTPILVFPDFNKPFLLETDASKEGLGVVLSQKQSDGCYHPVTFGSCSLTPSEKNYHSSKLEFNPLTYVLMPNLDATGHQWVSALAPFQFELEYQKGTGNGAADALNCIPISHSQETVQFLLEGTIVGAVDSSEVGACKELLEEHECLSQEARVQAVKLAPMHIIDMEEAQEADTALAACRKWLCLRKDMWLPWQDTFLKECLRAEAETEQGKMFFHIRNSLILNKGLMYVSTTPKGETEGVLVFVVPVGQCWMVLNGVHHDAGHQGWSSL